jgi:hypothetical protein
MILLRHDGQGELRNYVGSIYYVLIFLPMDEGTYAVEWQTKTYVTRFVGMSLFSLPMDDARQ